MEPIVDKNFLTQEQKDFINDNILSTYFPYYLNSSSVSGDNNKFASHIILRRPEDRKDGETFASDYWEPVVDIFKTFINKHNIDYKEMLRCSVNLTFKTNSVTSPIHRDHEYDHKNLLVYITDCVDKDAKTVLLDDNEEKITHESIPEKYKGLCFDGVPHYHYYPKKDIRVVLVYTFR
tara:strand:+ start:50 stop:583 length:534 start_codon:yes stop_codon:yes gene_type:complete